DPLPREREFTTGRRGLSRQFADIRAGRKGFLARTGEDDDADAVVAFQREQRPCELVEHRRVDRVQHVRTVERDHGDRLGALDCDGQQPACGNGYINEATTIATTMKPTNMSPPNRACSRTSSLAIIAKTSDTKNANSVIRKKWLCMLRLTSGPSRRRTRRSRRGRSEGRRR